MSKKKPEATKELSNGQTVDDILLNWRTLANCINDLDEEDLKTLMTAEKAGTHRDSFMTRLFGRYSQLRTEREREEYLGA